MTHNHSTKCDAEKANRTRTGLLVDRNSMPGGWTDHFSTIALVLLMACSAAGHTYGNYSGDILLTGYFPVHESRSDARDLNNTTKYCGAIMEQDGIQVSLTLKEHQASMARNNGTNNLKVFDSVSSGSSSNIQALEACLPLLQQRMFSCSAREKGHLGARVGGALYRTQKSSTLMFRRREL